MVSFHNFYASNLGFRTRFVLEGCSKTESYFPKIKEINSFHAPKEKLIYLLTLYPIYRISTYTKTIYSKSLGSHVSLLFFFVRVVREPNFCSRTELFLSRIVRSKTELFELQDVRKPRFDCISNLSVLISLPLFWEMGIKNTL